MIFAEKRCFWSINLKSCPKKSLNMPCFEDFLSNLSKYVKIKQQFWRYIVFGEISSDVKSKKRASDSGRRNPTPQRCGW
jgi:hypothetical protein